jgi:hypothetical protein
VFGRIDVEMPDSATEARAWRRTWPWRRILGYLCIAIGIAFTVWLGVLGASKQPPTKAESGLLVLLSAIFQVGGAAVFNSIGKADPSLARSSVRRLARMTRRASEARKLAEGLFEDTSAMHLRDGMGSLSVRLSYLEEDAVLAIEDWKEFHADALRKLKLEYPDD